MEEIQNINEAVFPEVKEGDKVLWFDNQWYKYVSGQWILES